MVGDGEVGDIPFRYPTACTLDYRYAAPVLCCTCAMLHLSYAVPVPCYARIRLLCSNHRDPSIDSGCDRHPSLNTFDFVKYYLSTGLSSMLRWRGTPLKKGGCVIHNNKLAGSKPCWWMGCHQVGDPSSSCLRDCGESPRLLGLERVLAQGVACGGYFRSLAWRNTLQAINWVRELCLTVASVLTMVMNTF